MFVNKPVLLVLVAAFVCAVPAAADDIALSLVHGQDRIDIPTHAIVSIEAQAMFTYVLIETQEVRSIPSPHVEICFTAAIGKQVCQLTRRIVEQPLDIVVDCAVISRPVVREPLCKMPCFQVSTNDIFEANALAQRLRQGSNRRCAPVS